MKQDRFLVCFSHLARRFHAHPLARDAGWGRLDGLVTLGDAWMLRNHEKPPHFAGRSLGILEYSPRWCSNLTWFFHLLIQDGNLQPSWLSSMVYFSGNQFCKQKPSAAHSLTISIWSLVNVPVLDDAKTTFSPMVVNKQKQPGRSWNIWTQDPTEISIGGCYMIFSTIMWRNTHTHTYI